MSEGMPTCARCGEATGNLRYCNDCAPVRSMELPPAQDLYKLEQYGYRLDQPSPCRLCGRPKNISAYCARCTEAMAAVAIATAQDAPAADWRETERGTYWTRFDDGQLARVSAQDGLLPFHFSILDETGETVVRDDALDAGRARRYAECAHLLLHWMQAAIAATVEGRGKSSTLARLSALLEKLGDPTLPLRPGESAYGPMDLAELAYWIDLPACLRCLRYACGTPAGRASANPAGRR